MHYLITGHTGFKGAWLSTWLASRGHKVSGIALDPLPGDLYEIANVSKLISDDLRIDIRNGDAIKSVVKKLAPDVVFHMAAQPLVLESFKDPRGTFETNTMGTLNVLEAVSNTPSVKAQVIITTDKVYKNLNGSKGHSESDPLGGDDPYSASKAMADILTHSWVTSFKCPPTTVVRAGNVIGGGDFAKDRLIPDLIKAYFNGERPTLRNPDAVRPWQHVLDCLNGYLIVSDKLLAGEIINVVNIGPDEKDFMTVSDVVNLFKKSLEMPQNWEAYGDAEYVENQTLRLNTEFASTRLKIRNKFSSEESIKLAIRWYLDFKSGQNPKDLILGNIEYYEKFPRFN